MKLLTVVALLNELFHLPTTCVSFTVLLVNDEGSTAGTTAYGGCHPLSTINRVYYVKCVAEHVTSPVLLLTEFNVILVLVHVSVNLSLLAHLIVAVPFNYLTLISSLILKTILAGVDNLVILS